VLGLHQHGERKVWTMSTRALLPPCWVCGAPAPVMIASRAGTRNACYTHEDTKEDS